jgi:predicted nucleotidyltransferase
MEAAMTLHGIEIPKARIEEFCRANGIGRLSFFGSVLRSDFGPDSDIDVLVEFLPGVRVGYLAIARMARELTALLGRDVDLRTPAELHRAFRDEVLKEALVEYVAA